MNRGYDNMSDSPREADRCDRCGVAFARVRQFANVLRYRRVSMNAVRFLREDYLRDKRDLEFIKTKRTANRNDAICRPPMPAPIRMIGDLNREIQE